MNELIAGLKSTTTTSLGIFGLMALVGITGTQLLDGDAATNPDWNVVVVGVYSTLVAIFCRDAGKTSESVGAK